jgi:cytochrome c oxidase assembly protein subunit 15
MVIEWTHRWLAALVGILAIATAVSAWRNLRHRSDVVTPAIAAVVVIGIQAWVGRLVVKGDLAADLVSIHLGISMVVVALLTVVVVATSLPQIDPEPSGRRRGWTIRVGVAAAASFLLIILGSVVHNRYFPGWPLMDNTLIPDLSNTMAVVHYLHRLMAGVLLVFLGYLMFVSSQFGIRAGERRLIVTAGTVYLINVALGAAHVFTMVSSAVLVSAHLGLAAAVWSLLVASTTFSILLQRVPSSGSHLPASGKV